MRHVDRPAPGRLVSRGLRLLAAGHPTGLLTVTGLLTASRGAAGVLLIGLFQGDLFLDSLPFTRGFLISQFLVGRLAGARFLVGKHAEQVAEVEMADDAVLRDFDTTESLATLPARMRPEGIRQ